MSLGISDSSCPNAVSTGQRSTRYGTPLTTSKTSLICTARATWAAAQESFYQWEDFRNVSCGGCARILDGGPWNFGCGYASYGNFDSCVCCQHLTLSNMDTTYWSASRRTSLSTAYMFRLSSPPTYFLGTHRGLCACLVHPYTRNDRHAE